MDRREIVSNLNDLIETSNDGETGFRTCADGVQSPRLKAILNEASQRCAEGAAELERLVHNLGGDAATTGSVGGTVHRAWTNIKSTITGMDEAAVLAECERGEDVAEKIYQSALEKDLPKDIRTIVERQYQGVKQNHDLVRSLRDAAA